MTVTSLCTDMTGNIISQILLLNQNLTNIWETFRDQLLSQGTGRLIPDQAEDPVDVPLQVQSSRLGPVDNERFSGPSVLLASRKCFPLSPIPIPGITLKIIL